MSVACPEYPPDGWCIIILELFNAYLLPLVPAIASNDPAEEAWPITSVEISHFTNCMVSYIAKPAVTNPPGELMYIKISLSGACDSKNNNCADTTEATLSFIPPVKNIILSFKRRENIS